MGERTWGPDMSEPEMLRPPRNLMRLQGSFLTDFSGDDGTWSSKVREGSDACCAPPSAGLEAYTALCLPPGVLSPSPSVQIQKPKLREVGGLVQVTQLGSEPRREGRALDVRAPPGPGRLGRRSGPALEGGAPSSRSSPAFPRSHTQGLEPGPGAVSCR